MSVRDLKKLIGDRPLNQVQQNVQQALQPIINSQILNGNQLDGVVLVAGSNTIEHKLGRKLIGYIVCRKDANISIWDTQATNLFESKTLLLEASGPATISLWVY